MTVLAIIPARGGSKGVPRKNVRLLAGKPLLAHTVEAARSSERIARLIVSTDDTEIAQEARAYGAEVPFMRPAALASDTASTIAVAQHAVQTLETYGDTVFEVILLLQPTAPLRQSDDIDGALALLEDDAVDSVVSFYAAEHVHPYYMYTIEDSRPKPFMPVPQHITRRQDFPAVYVRNGAIYAVRRTVLFEHNSFLGPNLRAYLMPYERSINVDTEMDLRFAEFLLTHGA